MASESKTWVSFLWPLGIALAFLGWGLFMFYAVGNRPPPQWFYGSVSDVPGQSEYSTSAAKQFYLNATSPEKQGRVERQHVKGDKNLPDIMPGEKSE